MIITINQKQKITLPFKKEDKVIIIKFIILFFKKKK